MGNEEEDPTRLHWGTGHLSDFVRESGGKGKWVPATEAQLRMRDVGWRVLMPMSTTSDLPGMTITGLVGVVSGVSTLEASVGERKSFEHDSRKKLLAEAQESLARHAVKLGADAVIGLSMTWASGNVGGVTIGTAAGRGDKVSVFLLGTAVKAHQTPA